MNSESESGWNLSHVSSTPTSIHFVCEILKPETITGCTVVVHNQSHPQDLILTVTSSDNGGTMHFMEVETHNKGELYYYAVFPITRKGIIGSIAIKGSIHINGKGIY